MSTVLKPRSARRRAAIEPEGPAPIMATSNMKLPSHPTSLIPTALPLAPTCYPKGDENQLYIENKSLLPDVQQIVAEFFSARHISRRKYLRDAGQTWCRLRSQAEQLLHPFFICCIVFVHFHFVWKQRARPHKAHVPDE